MIEIDNKIAIDVDALIYSMWTARFPAGINRVTLEYIKHYKHDAIVALHFKKRYFFIKHNFSQKFFEILLSGRKNYSKWAIIKLVIKMLFSIDYKINYSKTIVFNLGHSSFQLKRQFKDLTLIFMSHDIIPIVSPEYSRIALDHKHSINIDNIKSIASTAKIILCNSHDTENQLKQLASDNNFKLPPTQVVLLGNNLMPYGNDKISPGLPHKQISKPYFIILGTIEPRKNHMLLLNIWKRLLTNKFNDYHDLPNLLIIGKRGWKCDDVTNVLDNCQLIRNHVFEINNCDDIKLSVYLKGAKALLFPSFVEGYGFPLVEALGVGTPVIVSDIPVFREIAHNIPEYIDPLDGVGWMNMVMEYMKPNSKMRENQLKRMIDYASPTWEDHLKIVDSIIHQLEYATTPVEANKLY